MHEIVTFDPTQMLGIIDLRSLGYYKIKHGVLQQNPSHIYHFESAHKVCDQFNRLIDMLRKGEKLEGTEKYPWLDDSDERKYMTDKEVLERYINLDNSCLNKWEKKEVRSLLYRYKDAFSLRDEIGTCPNIEVGIDDMDKRPFHAREEDKALLDKEMKRLPKYIEGRLFSLFKPSCASKQKINKRQKGHDRFQVFKHENSQEQCGLSFVQGHIHLAWKL